MFISVRLIFVQVQVFDTETHRSDNLQIEIMSVTSYVDETARLVAENRNVNIYIQLTKTNKGFAFQYLLCFLREGTVKAI